MNEFGNTVVLRACGVSKVHGVGPSLVRAVVLLGLRLTARRPAIRPSRISVL
jgi:hypothetical protein